MSIAILHGFKLPEPMPNAWPARREVCIRELPNDEKRSPYSRSFSFSFEFVVPPTIKLSIYRLVQDKILSFNIRMDISGYLERDSVVFQ
jgi:hypothetical protein